MTNPLFKDKVIITLIDSNKDTPGSTRCGDGIKCVGLSCDACPCAPDRDNMNLGEVRKLDPRNLREEGTEEASLTYTGGSADYYQVTITNPTTKGRPQYIAECNDIIETLGMNFAEGNAFKALWRRAAHRTLGKRKAGAKADGLYDAQKVEFFGARLVSQSRGLKDGTD